MLPYEDLLLNELTAPKPGPGAPILIVEDDRSLKMVFDWLIRDVDPGLKFDWCSSVDQAKEALTTGKYRLVISDFMIEGMGSGLDVWEHFCRHQAGARFAMMSALDLSTFCRLDGQPDARPELLRKPINVDEVQKLIRSSTAPAA
jgi:DNA-binding NtrC family response regulator